MSGKKKESGKFRSVLLIIILPLMFLLIAGGIVLWAAGINVIKPIQDAAAKTPVLKELVLKPKIKKAQHQVRIAVIRQLWKRPLRIKKVKSVY